LKIYLLANRPHERCRLLLLFQRIMEIVKRSRWLRRGRCWSGRRSRSGRPDVRVHPTALDPCRTTAGVHAAFQPAVVIESATPRLCTACILERSDVARRALYMRGDTRTSPTYDSGRTSNRHGIRTSVGISQSSILDLSKRS
jgi:hypothetical protein